MKRDTLKKYTKDELIDIIVDIEKKYSLKDKEIVPLSIEYKFLLESASDVIFVLDREENLIYGNFALCELFLSEDTELGENYFTYLPEVERERARFVIDTIFQKGESFENELMKTSSKDGRTLYFTSSFSPFKGPDGDIKGIVGIMRNITERYLMEKKLKENSRILEEKVKELIKQSEVINELKDLNDDLINNAPIGIFMMDPSGIMLSENAALKEIMGRKPEESVVGINLLNTKGFREAGFVELFEQGVREKKMLRVNNAAYRPISGADEIIINVTLSPILDKSGQHVEKVIIMVEDNTEQYRITQKINRVEKLSSLGLLASGVAAELRNYINKMVMDLNFVGTNVEPAGPAAEYVDSLKKELDRIKNISEQLLSLSNIDESEKDICELNKVVSSHPVEVMMNRLEKSGYNIKIELSQEQPCVKANITQLEQVLIQFLENAEEAMPEGGSITVATEIAEIDDCKYALMTVSDTGIGISEENIKTIFQPFFTTKGAGATGLGLMIVMSIVENLGATIGVKSNPGEGTSITVAFLME